MLANELYWADDPELVQMRYRAQWLLDRFNATRADQRCQRQHLVRTLFGQVGKNATINPTFRCDYGCHIFAGDNLFVNYDCVILDCNTVRLGSDVMLAPGVHIYTAYHPTAPEVRRSGLEQAAPVTIGDNVWLGGQAVVCAGVTIGSYTAIGAGSVVVKDIPERVVAVGNPCRAVRSLP